MENQNTRRSICKEALFTYSSGDTSTRKKRTGSTRAEDQSQFKPNQKNENLCVCFFK